MDRSGRWNQEAGFGVGTYPLFETSNPITGSLDPATWLDNKWLAVTKGGAEDQQEVILTVVPVRGSAVSLLSGLGMLLGMRNFRWTHFARDRSFET